MNIRKLLNILKCILILLPLGGLGGSCSSDFTYSSYPCYLHFENDIHMDATIASAMNVNSPGVFCLITCNEAKKTYTFTNNYGLTSTVTFNQKDSYYTRDLGMNGALIVGFGNLDGRFYAYDRECPVCFDPDAIPVRSKPLSMTETGMATCSVCHRQWNMNTGGNFVGMTDGTEATSSIKGLTLYHAGTTGPYGVLSVGN